MTDTNAGREALAKCLRFAAIRHTPEIDAAARAYVASLVSAAAERDELKARCEKAELRTLALYTPLWEHGYDCHDYEAQAIVGEALQAERERDELRAEVERLQSDIRLMSAPHESVGAVVLSLRSRLASAERVVEAAKYHAHTAPVETNPCDICEQLAAHAPATTSEEKADG